MQRPDQIIAFLTSNKPKAYCDDCIAAALTPQANRHYVASITNSLAKTPPFQREHGQCSGNRSESEKLVIRAV